MNSKENIMKLVDDCEENIMKLIDRTTKLEMRRNLESASFHLERAEYWIDIWSGKTLSFISRIIIEDNIASAKYYIRLGKKKRKYENNIQSKHPKMIVEISKKYDMLNVSHIREEIC